MIDIHCHILPAIDDGPSDIDESIEMARVAALDGITRIVATPHLRDEIHPAALIRDKADELNARLVEEGIDLKILRGADVSAMLAPAFLRDYTINGTDYLLIEFPHSYLPANARETVFRLMVAGFRPIITHPERNASVLREPGLLFDIMESGPLLQITADSLTGAFGSEVRECALFLLEKGVVGFIASDAHSSRGRRPVLSEGLRVAERVLGKERAQRLVSSNPEAVLAGRPLDG